MRWNQKAAVFTENTTETVNPARGFYSIFPFRLDEACDLSNMEYSLKKNQYLCLVEISIAGYRDRDLDRAGLDQFDQILRFFVLHGKDIILRVVYDWEGKGLEKEPLSRAQIKRHMQAVKMVLKPYQKALYLSQGIFVGSWGEMHTSRFLSKDAVTDLFFTWQAAFEEVPVALRRPDYIRMILSEENYRKLQKNDKKKAEENGILLAFYNDALFSSEDDLGTYGMEKKSKTVKIVNY